MSASWEKLSTSEISSLVKLAFFVFGCLAARKRSISFLLRVFRHLVREDYFSERFKAVDYFLD